MLSFRIRIRLSGKFKRFKQPENLKFINTLARQRKIMTDNPIFAVAIYKIGK